MGVHEQWKAIQRWAGVTVDGVLDFPPSRRVDGSGRGSLNGPAIFFHPAQKVKITEARVPWDVKRVDGRAIPIEEYRATLIPALFIIGGPATVFGAVRSVRVDPVKRVARGGLRPHISQKGIGGIAPSFAHFYASRAIRFIVVVSRIVTARLRRLICLQLRARLPISGMSVSKRAQANGTLGIASAAFRGAALYLVSGSNNLIPAFAFKQPFAPSAVGGQRSDDRQSACWMQSYLGSRSHGIIV